MALVVNAFFANGIFETNVFCVSTHAHFLMCMHIRGTKLYSAPAQHLVSVRSEQWFPPSIKVIHVFLQLTCDHLVSEHDLLLKARDANLAILKSMVKDPMLRYPPQEELLLQR